MAKKRKIQIEKIEKVEKVDGVRRRAILNANIRRRALNIADADKAATLEHNHAQSVSRDSIKIAFKGASRVGKTDVFGNDKGATTAVATRLAMRKGGMTYSEYVTECRRLGVAVRPFAKISSFFTNQKDQYSLHKRGEKHGVSFRLQKDGHGKTARFTIILL